MPNNRWKGDSEKVIFIFIWPSRYIAKSKFSIETIYEIGSVSILFTISCWPWTRSSLTSPHYRFLTVTGFNLYGLILSHHQESRVIEERAKICPFFRLFLHPLRLVLTTPTLRNPMIHQLIINSIHDLLGLHQILWQYHLHLLLVPKFSAQPLLLLRHRHSLPPVMMKKRSILAVLRICGMKKKKRRRK